MYQELQETDSEVYLVLSYNGVKCMTNKTFLGLLGVIPFDFNQIDVLYDKITPGDDCFALACIYFDSLMAYIKNNGCDTISDYFAQHGWKEPKVTKQYNPILEDFVPLLYYTKDGYCTYIENYSRQDDEGRIYQRLIIYKMPENFVALGLDTLLSNQIYNLFYRVERRRDFYIGEIRNPILSISGKVTTLSLQYFSTEEKNTLIQKIIEFYGSTYETYNIENSTDIYLHFSGNDKFDIVIMTTPTANGYVDIQFTLIEKNI